MKCDTDPERNHAALLFSTAFLAMLLASCVSVGPKTIQRDQFDYGTAIANAEKEQLLFNVVRLRYVEAPVFVDVSSVINQYSLEGQVNLGAGFNTSIGNDNTGMIGGTGKWSDRPTITYNPISGKEFARSLLTPIPGSSSFCRPGLDYAMLGPSDYARRAARRATRFWCSRWVRSSPKK